MSGQRRCEVKKLRKVLVLLVLLLVLKPVSADPPPLHLPFFEGEEWWCAQGNNQGPTHYGSYAHGWDFNWGSGTDDEGKPVCAPAAGTIVYSDWHGVLGNVVIIDYDNSDAYGMLAHLEMRLVGTNEHVQASQVVGLCGGTGGWSPHLHYQTQDANWRSIPSHFEECGVPVTGEYYLSQNSQIFADAYDRQGGQDYLGEPLNDIHWYYDYEPQTEEMNCYVQDYNGGAFGPCAIVYDSLGGAHRAVVVRSGFWGYWRTLGAGGPRSPLGQALTDEYAYQGTARQDFLFGYLVWQNSHARATYYSDIGSASPGYGSEGHTHSFLDYYNNHGAGTVFGQATNMFGGGAGVRRWGNMEIQFFTAGSHGDCAITYNRISGSMAYVLRGRNFAEYMARWCPGQSGQFIGAPFSDPFQATNDRGLRQNFDDGYYMLDQNNQVRVYASNGQVLDADNLYIPETVSVVDEGQYSCDPTFHFFWPVPDGSRDFYLQVATDPDFSEVEWEGWVDNTSGDKPYVGQPGRTYYGRVRCQGANGVLSAYGASNDGIVVGCGVPCRDEGVFSNDPVVHFSYDVPANMDQVHLQVATASDFSQIVWESDLPASGDWAYSGSDSQTYFARVKLRESGGQWGGYGSPSDGITIGMTFPCLDEGDMSVDPVFHIWVDYVPGMVSTYFQVATDPLFSPGSIYWEGEGSGTDKAISGQYGVTYYARAKVLDEGWHWNGYGASTNGLTIGRTPISSDEGQVSVDPSFIIYFEAIAGAQLAHMQVARDSGFTNIFWESDLGVCGWQLLQGNIGEIYYGRVRFEEGGHWGNYGQPSDGITIGFISPTYDNGDYSANQEIAFSWDYPTGLAGVQLQIATDTAFTNIVDDRMVSADNYTFSGTVDEIYYARVRGCENGYGEWGVPSDGILVGSESWTSDEGEVSPDRLVKFTFDTYPGINNTYCQVATDATFENIFWSGWINTTKHQWYFSGVPGQHLYARVSLQDPQGFVTAPGLASNGILIQTPSMPTLQNLLLPYHHGQLARNLIQNGSFEIGTIPWQLEDHLGYGHFWLDDTSAQHEQVSAKITQDAPSDEYYQVQLKQTDFPLIAGQDYRLSFWARSNDVRQIYITVMQNDAPWNNLGLWTEVALDDQWQYFEFPFTATMTLAENTRLTFLLGESSETVWFDGVELWLEY